VKRMKWLAPAFALALAAPSLSVSQIPALLAHPGRQDPSGSRKPACGCYVCGKLEAVEFANKAKDCAGILAEDACGKYLGSDGVSPETRRSFSDQVKSKGCRTAAGDSPNGKYCGNNMPGKGFVYGNADGGRVYDEPSSSSPTSGTIPKGSRLLYTKTMRTADGQTWYYTGLPGTTKMGWVPGSDVSCARPYVPLPPRPNRNPPPRSSPNISAAQTAGSRG
jgi:hypothetical protein